MMDSSFRSAARRTGFAAGASQLKSALVSEEWIGLSPPPAELWALNGAERTASALLRGRERWLEAARCARRAAEGVAKPDLTILFLPGRFEGARGPNIATPI